MSVFDLDAFREAHRPWEFRADGFTFTARVLSAEHLRAFNLGVTTGTEKQRGRALHRLLRHAFPRQLSHYWRGDPVRKMLALEPEARNAVLESFFEWVRRTQALPPHQQTTPTRGPRSSPPTPARTM